MLVASSVRRILSEEEPDPGDTIAGEIALPQPPPDLALVDRYNPLLRRVATAAGEILGQRAAEVLFTTLLAVKRGQLPMHLARQILERTLPETRPTPVRLPLIETAADLVEADRRLMAAANVGMISHREWATTQEILKRSWELRQLARAEEG